MNTVRICKVLAIALLLSGCCNGSQGWTDDGSDYDTRVCPDYVSDCTD